MKIQTTVIAFIMALLLSALAGCSSKTSGLKEGGIYYFKNEHGAFSVLKILKVESAGVHFRIYSNQFDSPPDKVDESTLTMAGLNHKPNEITGVPDMALTGASFASVYKITFVQQSTVTDQELEPYKSWKKGNGKYF